MIVIVWRAAAAPPMSDVRDWLGSRRSRIIVEYALPKAAWSIAVVETEGMGPVECRRTPPDMGIINTDNPADGMLFARRLFEASAVLSSAPALGESQQFAAGTRCCLHRRAGQAARRIWGG